MIRSQAPRRGQILAAFATVFFVIAACSSARDSSEVLATAAPRPEETLSVLLMARDVDITDTRLPIVVLLADEDRTQLDDRADQLRFQYRHIDDENFKSLGGITWRQWPVRGGAYTATPRFDRPGVWEVQVSYTANSATRVGSSFLQVETDSSAPGIGDLAPVTVTKTAQTVAEVEQISSAINPDPRFYSISLDEALSNGRPTIVLFSTPAFCQTQTCGPQLDTLGLLMDRGRGRMDFIHVEIFDNIREMLDTGDASIGEVAQPVEDWGLITEPWTFFVDGKGVISARFEQFTTLDELTEAADVLLASG